MNFINICSGSKKNSSIIYDETTLILIDCGASIKELKGVLESINKKVEDIGYVLLTHNHIDHIKNINHFDDNKIHCMQKVYDCKKENRLKFFKTYNFGDFIVTPLKESHDSNEISGFLFENNGEKLGYITDTGYLPFESLIYLKNLDFYYFESNHDVELLVSSNRSDSLKSRILGYKGHLSNEQAAYYMAYLLGDRTKSILLAHLSEECNTPNCALKTFKTIFKEHKLKSENYDIRCCKQSKPTIL